MLLAVLAKSTKLVKALKMLKFGKVLITFLSMTLSAFAYAFLLGPWFAIGFVAMLFIHEMGHVIAMKAKGMPTAAPVFIPFLGAVIFSPPFKSKEDEAFIGYAGPLVGGFAAAMLFAVWCLMPEQSEILLLVSYTATFLNLFNLMPIRPMDGGRTTQIIGEWFKYLGLVGLLLFVLYIRTPAILLILILVMNDLKMRPWRKFLAGSAFQIVMMGFIFVGLGDQPWLIDLIDIVFATLFNMSFFAEARKSSRKPNEDERAEESENDENEKLAVNDEEELEEDQEGEEENVPVAIQVRIKWFVLYFALVIALFLLMLAQVPYLPHPVKNTPPAASQAI